jgi:hypothetical protein
MTSGSRWSQIVRTVGIFVLVGVVAGVIDYFAVPGSHRGNLTYAIIAGAVVAGFGYFRSRARRAGRDPVYNAGRQLRHQHEDQLGEGGRPLSPGEAPRVVDREPQRRG